MINFDHNKKNTILVRIFANGRLIVKRNIDKVKTKTKRLEH